MLQTERSKPRSKSRRRWVWVIGIGVFMVIGSILLIPMVVSSSPMQQWLEKRIGQSLGGPLSFQDLSMGWLAGIQVRGLSFSDAAGGTSVAVENVSVTPAYGSLLSGRISGRAVVDRPEIDLTVLDKAQPAPVRPQSRASGGMTLGQVDLQVNQGQVTVTDPKSGSVRMADINVHVRLKPPGKTSQMTLTMTLPQADNTAKVDAEVLLQRPVDPEASLTAGDIRVKGQLTDLDLAALKPVFALAKVGIESQGKVTAELNGQIENGQVRDLMATMNGRDLVVTGSVLNGDRLATKRMDVKIKVTGKQDVLQVDELKADGDWFHVQAAGSMPSSTRSLSMAANLEGSLDVDVAKVLSQLPKTIGLKDSMQVTSGKLQGTVKFAAGEVAAQMKLVDLAGTSGTRAVGLSQPVVAVLRAKTGGEAIRIEQLEVNSSFAQVRAQGDMQRIEHKVAIDLQKLQAELGRFVDLGTWRLAGTLASDGIIRVAADKTAFQGSASIGQLQVTGPNNVTISEPKATVEYAMDMTPKAFSIGSFAIDSGLMAMQIKDAVVPMGASRGAQDTPPLTFPVLVSKVDLGRVRPILVALGYLDPNMVLSGVVSSPMQVTFDSTGFKVTSDQTRIDRFRCSLPNVKDLYEPNQVQVAFTVSRETATGTLDADLHLKAPVAKLVDIPTADVRYTATPKTTTMKGLVLYGYDLSVLGPALAGVMPKDLVLKGRRQENLRFEAQYPAGQSDLLANLNAQTQVGFDQARYMGIDLGTTDVNLVVDKGVFHLVPFSTTANQGRLNFGAQAQLTGQGRTARMPMPMNVAKEIHITKEMSDQLLQYVNPLFAKVTSISGVVNFQCDKLVAPIPMDPNHLEVTGTIGMSEVLVGSPLLTEIFALVQSKMSNQRLVVHPTRFSVSGGVVRYENMQIDVGDYPITFSGAVGLDQKLDMTVTLPFTILGKTAKIGQSGAGRIAVALGGTLTRPALKLDKMFEKLLQQGIEEQGLQLLEGLLNKKK